MWRGEGGGGGGTLGKISFRLPLQYDAVSGSTVNEKEGERAEECVLMNGPQYLDYSICVM